MEERAVSDLRTNQVTLRRLGYSLTLLLILLASTGVDAQEPQPPPTADVQHAQPVNERIARLEGAVEALGDQLETERAVAERTLSTVERIVTYGTIIVGAIAAVLAVWGYRDLRQRVDDLVTQRLNQDFDKRVDTSVNARLDSLHAEWDRKFSELAESAERLLKESKK